MTVTAVAYAFADVTITNDSILQEINGPVYIAAPGTVDPNAGIPLRNQPFYPAGTVIALRGPGLVDISDYYQGNFGVKPATGDWSVADAAAANKATVTIVNIPSLQGGQLVSIQWTKNAGVTWTDMVRLTPGTEDIDCGATGAFNIQLRVQTKNGVGIASAIKAVTVA